MLSRRFFAVMLLSTAFLATTAQATPVDDAKTFIQNLGQNAIDSLTAPGLTDEARKARFKALLDRNFDVPGIGRFVLGRYWRRATPEQQAEYSRLFETLIVQTYSQRFAQYSGLKLKVEGARDEGDDAVVNSEVLRGDGGPPIRIDWHVKGAPGHLKIDDVVVEGVSMSATQRSDFAAIIERGGGTIQPLLDALKQKTETGSTLAGPPVNQ